MKYSIQIDRKRWTVEHHYTLIAGISYYNATTHFIPLPFARLMLVWSQVARSPGRELLDKAQTLLYSMEAEVTRGGAVVSSLGS